MLRAAGALALVAGCLGLSACGASVKDSAPAAAAVKQSVGCPAAWKTGWQRLANRIDRPVYCPGWMPNPLDAQIGSDDYQFTQLDKQKGYLVSFLYYDNSTEVHVNFRRFAGTAMPRCRDLDTTRMIACYSDPGGATSAHGIHAKLYTVGRDADQWHLSYLWRHAGSTYVVSEHVAQPYTYDQVKANVTRILRSLVLLQPAA